MPRITVGSRIGAAAALAVAGSALLACLSVLPAAASSLPSGERIVGGNGSTGGTVIEPVYDDMTGQIRYVSTPRGVPDPVHTNPRATAPFYLPLYPASSTVVTNGATLNCQDVPAENCPDHGPAAAQLAQLFEPTVYPGTLPGAVLGHDHLLASREAAAISTSPRCPRWSCSPTPQPPTRTSPRSHS